MKNKKDNDTVICILIAIALIFVITSVTIYVNNSSHNNTSSGIKWDGYNRTLAHSRDSKYIAIPCFANVNFKANQTEQCVNIYNPDSNECIMNVSMVLSDGAVIWESDNIHPGYGFHDITLTKPLSQGLYEARLVTRCFTMDKSSELNGGSFKFKINVQ